MTRLASMAFLAPVRLGICASLLTGVAGLAAEEEGAAKLWQQLQTEEKAMSALEPPANATLEQFNDFLRRFSEENARLADRAAVFWRRFPENAHRMEAREKRRDFLEAAAFSIPARKEELNALEREMIDDPKVEECERAWLLREVWLRKAWEAGASAQLFQEGLKELKSKFPKCHNSWDDLFVYYLQAAPLAEALSQARQFLAQKPDYIRVQSTEQEIRDVVANLERVGKPLALRVTDLDGHAIDLAQFRGQVVLLDFWATWCRPCVGLLPSLRELHSKYHTQGLQILGISYDDERDVLVRFLQSNPLPWPQSFEGKSMAENPFFKEFKEAPPAIWLIDRKGNLRELNGKAETERKVKALLAETAE